MFSFHFLGEDTRNAGSFELNSYDGGFLFLAGHTSRDLVSVVLTIDDEIGKAFEPAI